MPFVFYDLESANALYPLERVPHEFESMDQWIELSFDYDRSKKEENAFPLELFDETGFDQDPYAQKAIQKLKSQAKPSLFGYSRWFDLHSRFRWAKCQILRFDESVSRTKDIILRVLQK